MTELFTISLSCSIVAFVYSQILIQQGHILHGFYLWYSRLLTKEIKTELPDTTPEEVRRMEGYEYKPVYQLSQKKSPMLKALGECPVCTAGQLSLWVYLFHYLILPHAPFISPILSFLSLWILFICTAILFTFTIKKLFEQWNVR